MRRLLRRAVPATAALFLTLLVVPSSDPRPTSGPSGTRLRLSVEEALARLPGRNMTPAGQPCDALNVVFVGRETEIVDRLRRAGWTSVPGSIAGSFLAGLRELAVGRVPASFPPMHAHLLFGRAQDHNFAIPTAFPHSRHHFRLWRSPFDSADGRPIWWGSAEYDTSIRWWDLSHRTDPETDRERDFVGSTLHEKARLLWAFLPQIPRRGANDRGSPFWTDGRALVLLFD